jgi:protocatechuate 4,5-dioxygenase alpha chain
MSRLENFDKTSRIHRLVFDCRKSFELRERWKRDFDTLAREYGLTEVETRALKELDLAKLRQLGVHPFYLNPIIRLFQGEDFSEFQPHTVKAFVRAYGSVADPQTYASKPGSPRG